MGPVQAPAPFVVVGVNFDVLLGVDFLYACFLQHDAVLHSGTSAIVLAATVPEDVVGASCKGDSARPFMVQLYLNHFRGTEVPEHLTAGVVEIRCFREHPIYLQAGWPVARIDKQQTWDVAQCDGDVLLAPAPPPEEDESPSDSDQASQTSMIIHVKHATAKQEGTDAARALGEKNAPSRSTVENASPKASYEAIDKRFISQVPSSNSCLTTEEVRELR